MAVALKKYPAVRRSDIDENYRELLTRFNSFLQACNDGNGQEIDNMLRHIDSYIMEHFGMEECLQTQRVCPEVEEYQAQHRFFMSELERLKRQAHGRECGSGLSLVADRQMVGWLVEHISGIDRAFGQFLKMQRPCSA